MKLFYEIIENNDYFIVVNKSSGIATIKETNNDFCLKSLIEKKESRNLYTVHRIDKDTSGIVIFAKDSTTHKDLNDLFEKRKVSKEYITVVYGDFPGDMKIEYPIEECGKKMKVSETGKYALTYAKVIERYGKFTLLKINLSTGRKHQIRVHLSFLGYPIVGDEVYGYKTPVFLSNIKKNYKFSGEEKPLISRTALHSHKLSFTYRGKGYSFVSSIPKDIRSLIYQLRKNLSGVNFETTFYSF